MNIVLIGYRGCGKTTVGRHLADALWMRFVDIDEQIARQSRRSVAEVLQLVGEEEFSRIETYIIASVSAGDNQVIGISGRALKLAANVESLKSSGKGKLIWLSAEPEVLAKRLAARGGPVNSTDTLAEVQAPLAQRAPVYESAADVTIDTTYLTVEQTVQQIVKRI